MLMGFETLRTFSGSLSAAESAPTASAAWKRGARQWRRRLKIAIKDVTTTGSPTSLTFAVWVNQGGTILKVGTFTHTVANPSTVTNYNVDLGNELPFGRLYITFDGFTGGTTPTVTAFTALVAGDAELTAR